jgi:transposase
VRVTTAFNKMLALPGASVVGFRFTPSGVVICLRRRSRWHDCPCGARTKASYDCSKRRWRHLDLGSSRCYLEAEIYRLSCPVCQRVRTEEVPWARPGSWHTRDFQDVVCYLAQRCDKTTICRLLRVSFEAVSRIVTIYVSEQLDPGRLDDLYRIGVDEISYRKGHRYLTVVADHDRKGAVVWVKEGHDAKTLSCFYEELGKERAAELVAVSMDMSGAYKKATDDHAPQADQCVDPFHVIKLANEAIDKTRRLSWNELRPKGPRPSRRRGRPKKGTGPVKDPRIRYVKYTRWALLKDPETLTDNQRAVLEQLCRERSVLYRCWQLKEALRDLYRLEDPSEARAHLAWWLAWASRSRVRAFVTLARTIRANKERVLAAVRLGLSNSKLEGLNSKIRLINHRGYGHSSLVALQALIYLCCGGVTVELPFQSS